MINFKEYVINRDMKIPIKKDSYSVRNKVDSLVQKEISFKNFSVRRMKESDIESLIEVDEQINEVKIKKYLQNNNVNCLVLEASNDLEAKPVGFIIFKNETDTVEILVLRYLLRYEDQFFDKLIQKVVGELSRKINKIHMTDNQSNHPSFYKRIKDYGFNGRKTNAGWEFTYEQANR